MTDRSNHTLRLAADLWEALTAEAKAQERTVTAQAVFMLRRGLGGGAVPQHATPPKPPAPLGAESRAFEAEALAARPEAFTRENASPLTTGEVWDGIGRLLTAPGPVATVGGVTVVDRDEVRAKPKAPAKRATAPKAAVPSKGRIVGYRDGQPVYR